MPVEEFELQTSSYRLAALAWGPAQAPPMLALHGWLDNAATFTRLAPLVDRFRWVALDFPGHGRSQHKTSFSPYLFVDYARVALEAATALGWERFCLTGHSLGANVATIMAAVARERVERLVLIEGIGPLTEEAARAPGRLTRYLHHMARLRARPLPVYSTPAEAVAVRVKASPMEPESAALIVARNLTAVPGGVSWRTDQKLTIISPTYLTEEHVLAFLQQIHAPTLLVRGVRGLLIEREQVSGRCARIADLSMVDLPGRHHLHLDEPAAVAAAIADFVDAHPAGTGCL